MKKIMKNSDLKQVLVKVKNYFDYIELKRVRGELTEQKILYTREDSELVELQANASDRNKAAELLGKRYALFTERKEISGNLGVMIIDDL